MRKKMFFAVFSVLIILAVAVSPAAAVTDGQEDGNAHPFVGLMVALDADGNALWRCSGTLLSPTLFLTAGHCTEEPAAQAVVWFDADVQALPACFDGELGDPCYPFGGGDSYHASELHTHPEFYDAPFFVHDVGVVILDGDGAEKSTYGTLPTVNQLDALKTKRGLKDVTFTAVGYGIQQSFPDAAAWKEHNVKIRMVAYPKLNQINTGFVGNFSLLLSNNASTGGTCFGDSGGPNFLGDSNVVAGVTSFAINGNCAGTGGVFRMDRADVIWFVSQYLD